MFSILIPTWNNLAYLKFCIESIRKNSASDHQIIVHVNDGSDGTIEYLKAEGVDFTQSDTNIGICFGVNSATHLAQKDYIVYMNDDMYVCPNWDVPLMEEIKSLNHDLFMFSGTLIEPNDTQNKCVIVADYGKDLATFRAADLDQNYKTHQHFDWNGSAWPPTIVSKRMWTYVGGYSTELSPGMSSDDDFAMKMWQAGCRLFKGMGDSRIYHFQAKSTHRIVKNDGRRQFLQKWNLNQSTFNKYFLKRGTPFVGPLTAPDTAILKKEQLRARLKIIFKNIK